MKTLKLYDVNLTLKGIQNLTLPVAAASKQAGCEETGRWIHAGAREERQERCASWRCERPCCGLTPNAVRGVAGLAFGLARLFLDKPKLH